VLELLRWTTGHFSERGIETARLDAECLLAHALGVSRLRLYLDFDKPIHEAERAVFRELVRRRASERVPVSQLVGRREFWSLSLRVSRDVLTPRPETEGLVAAALELLPQGNGEAPALEILDLGTGSGAIALALARERPGVRITATDVSATALSIAQQNAEELGMLDRIRFVAGDGFAAVPDARFDLVVSNPPYLDPAARGALPPELAHEPECALFAAEAGLGMLRRIAREAAGWLRPGAALALEHAPDQAAALAEALEAGGLGSLALHRDLSGNPRVTTARLRA
jgi:release factor glutamine methyltransferase